VEVQPSRSALVNLAAALPQGLHKLVDQRGGLGAEGRTTEVHGSRCKREVVRVAPKINRLNH
jgi:hypothetical protein